MAKSPTQRLKELEPLLVDIKGVIDALRQEVAGVGGEQQQTASSFTGLKTVLRERTEDLRSWKDDLKKRGEEWGRKLWMLVPVLIGVVLAFLLGYYLGKK